MNELAELFGDVVASGSYQWAPSSNMHLSGIESIRAYDSEEGSGDNGGNSVTIDGNGGGNKQNVHGTSATEKNKGSVNLSTSSLGVKRRGDAMKEKRTAAMKIVEALKMMVEEAHIERVKDNAHAEALAEEARTSRMEEEARRMAAEARAYEISVLGVMIHLKQVHEVVCVSEFYKWCRRLLMKDPAAREVYVALKDTKDQLLEFLWTECYGDA